MQTIRQWLEQLGLPQYAEVFERNAVDLKIARDLTQQDLRDLGVEALGHRKIVLRAIAELNGTQAPAVGAQGVEVALPPERSPNAEPGERRQLTVLFCDLVGFTELASRLDPEDLQTIIRSYEDACAVCISRYEGYVFQRLGDGIVAFFGYPLAHEGEAERAIRAGLEILASLSTLTVADAGLLQVRIGIATGVVVVSSAGKSAVGETMNLAARLQGMTQPNSIVISERTRQLAGGAFSYEDLGQQLLKGMSEPTRACRVLGVSQAESRFDAATQSGLTPLVGREQEIALVLERWRLVQEGEGQVVLLSGEPGLGKSRIVRALRDALDHRVSNVLRLQCSPFYVNSAFYPIIDSLDRLLRFTREEPAASKLDKVEAFMIGKHARPALDVGLVSALLSIAANGPDAVLGMTPQQQKDETIRALVDLIEAIARAQPTLMLFEDAHWCDPTSLEMLGLLIDRLARCPLLLVITHRPDFQPPWGKHLHVTALALSRLSRAQSATLVSSLTGGKALPGDLVDQIVNRTDGVPLFLEELTKAVLESDPVSKDDDRHVQSRSVANVSIPATLRDSLMARLDRLAHVKEIAQIGAALGREFSYELLSAVASRPKAALDDALERLTASGLIFRRGMPPDATYAFKHALVQDAAYESLLKTARQELHGKIARVLEERFPGTKDNLPELLAHHLTAAGLIEPAIEYWRKAGELARGRVALAEAISHLNRGLDLVGTLPASSQRDAQELALRIPLGTAWMALRGWAAPEVETSFRPALPLVKSLNHRDSFLPVLTGLCVYTMNVGRVAESLKWVAEIQETAETLDDPRLRLQGHRIALAVRYFMGHLQEARRQSDRLAGLYEEDSGRHIESLTNSDPLIGRGVFGAPCLWMLGYPDQALRLYTAMEAHARARAHPFGLCFLLVHGSWLFDLRCESDQMLSRAEEGVRLGRTHRLPLFAEVVGPFWQATAWLGEGRAVEAIPQIRASLGKWSALGGHLGTPRWKATLAEGVARAGDIEQGLSLIDECIAQIERPGWQERVWLAEVLRLKGWMLQVQGGLDEAERNLRDAIGVAREQEAKGWELRAATTLARLMQARGDRAGARDLLAPVYDWFTEGFDTKDLKEAKALLDGLS